MLGQRFIPKFSIDLKLSTEPIIEEVPTLRLSGYVMSKLDWLLKYLDTEIGGYLVAEGSDPLTITDFAIVEQIAEERYNEFTKEGIMNYYMDMRDKDLDEWQCIRIWAHTHPAMPANPSKTDEDTFHDSFCNREIPGLCQPWAGMFIRSKTGENYFRISYNYPNCPPCQVVCNVVFDPSIISSHDINPEVWAEEVRRLVKPRHCTEHVRFKSRLSPTLRNQIDADNQQAECTSDPRLPEHYKSHDSQEDHIVKIYDHDDSYIDERITQVEMEVAAVEDDLGPFYRMWEEDHVSYYDQQADNLLLRDDGEDLEPVSSPFVKSEDGFFDKESSTVPMEFVHGVEA